MPASPLWNGRLVIARAAPTGEAAAEGEVAGGLSVPPAEAVGLASPLVCDEALELGDPLAVGLLFEVQVKAHTSTAVNSTDACKPRFICGRESSAGQMNLNAAHAQFAPMFRALRVAPVVALFAWTMAGINAQAFTLVATAKVTVTPASGLPTAAFVVDGQYGQGPCTVPLQFAFYFDTTINFMSATTVTACNASRVYDTGNISEVPPASDNAPGPHQVILIVTDAGTPMPQGSATAAYTINAPPPPPRPSPSKPPPPPPSPVRQSPPSTHPSTSPSTSPSTDASPNCPPGAVTAGCPSPTAKACPVGLLPAPGTGGWADNLIAGAMVLTVFPIAGLALFGPGPLWAAAYRRRKFLTLFGLSAMSVLVLNCTFPTASNPQTSATPSVVSTPSGCSA